MARKWKYPLTVIVAVALITTAFYFGRNSAATNGSASAATSLAPKTSNTINAFYLDLGASESLGFQPTGIHGHNGARTNTGYANDLVQREALDGVTLTLTQMGCPGDTPQSVLDTSEKDACYEPPQTQLTKAVAFLKAQSGPGLVTIDLGFNDVRPCMEQDPVNQTCLAAGIAAVGVDLPKVIAQLKAATTSDTHFVGVEYADPYLGYYLRGPSGPALATSTLVGMDQLDEMLGTIYTKAGIPVANVPEVFEINDNTPDTLDNIGTVPTNVEQACQLSWFCYGAPFGPDDHPNDAGYSLIASAIQAALPKNW
ncbi:MAG: SGNH/GDSL hydrolase family protein [Acidimicrobiales bacterium]